MVVYKLDKLAVFIHVVVFCCIKISETNTVDCSAGQSSESDKDCSKYVGSNYVQYYCRPPYTCCAYGGGCCFNGGTSDLYTNAELVGIILNSTAIIIVAILVLVICGATYCNNKDDTSHIFVERKK